MISLDEAIKHVEEVAEEQDKLCKRYDDASGYTRSYNEDIRTTNAKRCEECAKEHRQLAEWLKDYKRLLEQEPCEERISEWKKDFKEYINSLSMPRDDYKGIMEYIDEFPSAEKTAEWIEVIDEIDSLGNKTWHHKCSRCGNKDSGWGDYKYCPKCGAKMKEVAE